MKNLIILLITTTLTIAQSLPTNSIVKIHASLSIPSYKQPWQQSNRVQVSGSGVVITDNYIVTNAHVISNAKFVQVSKGNKSKRYTATIEYISDQADLALLKVKDTSFYNGIVPLEFTEDVSTGDSVTVLGYPLGGNNLSTTKGVVSRIEQGKYTWSNDYLHRIQVDAAINSGNSGGVAIDKNNDIVGIVMQGYSKKVADNIGYVIPSVIVKTFLEDIKDGDVDGFDNSNTFITRLINTTAKEYYNIQSDQGVLISKVEKGENAFKLADLVLEVEGNKIFNDGKVQTKYGQQQIRYYEQLKPVGETINFKIKRDGKISNIEYTLKRKHETIKYEYFKEPRYIIFGGLIFAPLTKNYLTAKKHQVLLFETYYKLNTKSKHVKEGVVIYQQKFSHEVNEGYEPYLYLINSVNGTKVVDFKHFVKLLDESKSKYTVIDFIDVDYMKYVFNTKEAKDSFEEIKNIYGLHSDRRVD